MKKIDMEEVVDHLGSEIRRALKDAVDRNVRDERVDEYQLFRDFKRAVGRRCRKWESVPDRCVRD